MKLTGIEVVPLANTTKTPVRTMADAVLLQLLEAEGLSEEYKNIVKTIGVNMLEIVDAKIDSLTAENFMERGPQLGDIAFYFVKQVAFAVAYAAACTVKPALKKRTELTDMLVECFKHELDLCNKEFIEMHKKGAKKQEGEVRTLLKAFGVAEADIEAALVEHRKRQNLQNSETEKNGE